MGHGVALALREASGSGGVVVGGVSRSCDVGWVGGESEVVDDVADEVGSAIWAGDANPNKCAKTCQDIACDPKVKACLYATCN